MTLSFDHTYDLDLVVSRSEFEIALSQKWDGWLTWNEKDVSYPSMTMILTSVTVVEWADVPDSDQGDFRCRRAVDISIFILTWGALEIRHNCTINTRIDWTSFNTFSSTLKIALTAWNICQYPKSLKCVSRCKIDQRVLLTMCHSMYSFDLVYARESMVWADVVNLNPAWLHPIIAGLHLSYNTTNFRHIPRRKWPWYTWVRIIDVTYQTRWHANVH